MRIWTIAEVLQAEPKTVVESVGGTLVDLSPVFRSKPAAAKKWTLQKATITDGTNRLLVKIWNHGELEKRMLQQRLYFSAVPGKRGGLSGCKTDLDTDKQGVTSLVLKLDTDGEIGFADAAAPAQRQPEPAQRQSAPAQQQSDLPGNEEPVDFNPVVHPPAPKEPPAPAIPKEPKAAWSPVDKKLLRLMRLRTRTLTVALCLRDKMSARGYNMSPDHVEKVDSWLAIEACRMGLVAEIPECDPPLPPTQPPVEPTDAAPY